VSVTCIADGRTHVVPDTELARGASQRNGHYVAVCGHVVAAAPMVVPDGEACPLCAEVWELTQSRQRASLSQRIFG
jgi:hypothetical protein